MRLLTLMLAGWVAALPVHARDATTTRPATTAGAPSTNPTFTRQQDIVYGRAHGTALTMDRFTPTDRAPNGAAVIVVVSGGWFSSHDSINPIFINLFVRPFLERGYTVLAVVPASQPKFTIPEIASHLDRAVRYSRAHAKALGFDPDRIGITGGSAGGHLSLLQATSPSSAKGLSLDPAEQVSGQVQATAVFFPPTDFLNWGKPDHRILDDAMIPPFRAAFDYHEMSEKTKMFERIEDRKRIDALLRQTSPLYHATGKTPPTLIIHGDNDTLVPIQQAEIFIDKLKDLGVPAELSIKSGAGHGWLNMQEDVARCADFFDKHLARKM